METVLQIQQVLVERLHGTLMGPVVESQEYDERTGKQYRVFKWEVANGTYVEKDLPHGWRVEIAPNNFNKSKLTLWISRKRKVDDTYEDGYPTIQTKTVGEVNLTPEMFKRFLTTKETINRKDLAKAQVNELPAVSMLSGNQTQIQHIKVDDHNYDERVVEEVLDESAGPLLGQQTGEWGIEGTSKKLVVDGATTPSGFGIKQSEVSPIGNGLSIENVETFPPDSDEDNIIYTLIGHDTDELTKTGITIERSLVNAAAANNLAIVARMANKYVEVQPIDKWHSILIAQKLDGLPAQQEWNETAGISLPDILTEAGVIWTPEVQTDGGAAGTVNKAVIIENEWRWNVSAESVVVAGITGRPYNLTKAGYRGNALVSVVRTFHLGPPPEPTEVIHKFEPVYGSISIHSGSWAVSNIVTAGGVGATKTEESVKSRYGIGLQTLIQQFGPVVHSNINITEAGTNPAASGIVNSTSGTIPGGGSFPAASASVSVTGLADLKLPASSTPLTTGNEFILNIVVKPWRLGYWTKEVYTAKIP